MIILTLIFIILAIIGILMIGTFILMLIGAIIKGIIDGSKERKELLEFEKQVNNQKEGDNNDDD